MLAVNGEIYNHQEIRRRYAGKYDFQTGSDCEVILALYREKGPDFLEELSGIFAFVLYDTEKDAFLIARDPIGVIRKGDASATNLSCRVISTGAGSRA